MRALWAPSVVFMDDIEPFDPKSGLYEWVRGPQAEPTRVLVASWGRGPVAGMKPGSVAQSLLGGRSQGREHFAFTEGKPKPEWPDLGPEATWLRGGLRFVSRTHRHTDWLLGQRLGLLQASVCSAEEWVSDGSFASGFLVEQERCWNNSLAFLWT